MTMTRTAHPFTSTSALSALDVDDVNNNRWRIPMWDQMPDDIRMQNKENDTVLLDFLGHLPTTMNEWTNPVMQWSVDQRLDAWTTAVSGGTFASSASEDIVVADAGVCVVGNGVYFPETNQVHLITAVNYTTNTVTVNTIIMGGQRATVAAGDTMFVLPPYMGELSKPLTTRSVLPGEPQFNYITIAAHYFQMSKMQLGANMNDGAGAGFLTLDRATQETVFGMRQRVQYGLMFQERATWADGTDGQFYIGGSLRSQLNTHSLDLSATGNTFTFPNLNDFFEPMFEPDTSSAHKDVICGRALFADALTAARDASRLVMSAEGETYMHPTFGGRAFDMQTGSGDSVTFIRDMKSLVKGLGNWGFVLDAANMGSGMYKGLGPQWFEDIQDPDDILRKKSAYLESFALNVFDETTMGIIKGGTLPLIP